MLPKRRTQFREAWQEEEGYALPQWESFWFQQVYAWACREAQAFLERLDAWLLAG